MFCWISGQKIHFSTPKVPTGDAQLYNYGAQENIKRFISNTKRFEIIREVVWATKPDWTSGAEAAARQWFEHAAVPSSTWVLLEHTDKGRCKKSPQRGDFYIQRKGNSKFIPFFIISECFLQFIFTVWPRNVFLRFRVFFSNFWVCSFFIQFLQS